MQTLLGSTIIVIDDDRHEICDERDTGEKKVSVKAGTTQPVTTCDDRMAFMIRTGYVLLEYDVKSLEADRWLSSNIVDAQS